MFVEQTLKKNRALMDTAFQLHGSGQILPDSYVVDVDAFCSNGKKILEDRKSVV